MECVKLKYFFKNEQKKTKMVRDERGYCSKGVGKKKFRKSEERGRGCGNEREEVDNAFNNKQLYCL